jgi:hypothetical protein
MRKSLEDIAHMLRPVAYSGNLPDDLKKFHYYIADCGHNIICILKKHYDEIAESNMDKWEVPVPVRYVIEHGYEIIGDYVIVDAEYDSSIGLLVDRKYDEF